MKKNWFFDLDDTLYSPEHKIVNEIQRNIIVYLKTMFLISSEQAYEKALYYSRRYGSTLQGLIQEENINALSYLEEIHEVPLKVLPPCDIKLREVLISLPGEKLVITNSLKSYAERVLRSLNILDQFYGIIDIVDMGYKYKSQQGVIQSIVEKLGYCYHDCFLVDDLWANLEQARNLGMKTILINKHRCEGSPDYYYKIIYEIEDIINKKVESAYE